ncbi:ABC transporter permease [Frankia sp. AiPs1]|uniref:ABC transporter permease n=1 Tax=Frankia sp. AiPa1 TaxID=573492 RepID=UPI00202B79CC|nr:ABC transporter permease [Frankia sp. AiPa1]MCL9762513.1 ABC transporter permease [Frankia sp. AiPa1]
MTLQPVLYSEWTKIRSVRSIVWALTVAAVLLIGFGSFACGAYGDGEAAQKDFDPLALAFWGVNFAQVAVAVFAMLAMGGEYDKGAIATSLTVVPQRARFYVGKLLVTSGLSLAVAIPATLITYFVAQGLLGEHGVSFGDPGTVRGVLSLIFYFPLLTLLCVGLAAIFRTLAATMGIFLPLLFLVSPLSMEVPSLRTVAQFLPDRAALYAAMNLHSNSDFVYDAWLGLPIMAVWTAALVFGGWYALRSRDA